MALETTHELLKLGGIEIRERPESHPVAGPVKRVVPIVDRRPPSIGPDPALLLRPDEQVDHMLAAFVHQCRNSPSGDVVEPATSQREAFIRKINDRGSEVETSIEPGFHRMLV